MCRLMFLTGFHVLQFNICIVMSPWMYVGREDLVNFIFSSRLQVIFLYQAGWLKFKILAAM